MPHVRSAVEKAGMIFDFRHAGRPASERPIAAICEGKQRRRHRPGEHGRRPANGGAQCGGGGLSDGRRGKRRPPANRSGQHDLAYVNATESPLPLGEGQGEGMTWLTLPAPAALQCTYTVAVSNAYTALQTALVGWVESDDDPPTLGLARPTRSSRPTVTGRRCTPLPCRL